MRKALKEARGGDLQNKNQDNQNSTLTKGKLNKDNYVYKQKYNYNLLFVDQPVGTGLAYADQSFPKAFVTSMDCTFFTYFRGFNRFLLRIGSTLQQLERLL